MGFSTSDEGMQTTFPLDFRASFRLTVSRSDVHCHDRQSFPEKYGI
jgi:hypothetical protein